MPYLVVRSLLFRLGDKSAHKTLASAVELFGNAKAWLLTNTESEFFEVVLRATERLQTRITEARK